MLNSTMLMHVLNILKILREETPFTCPKCRTDSEVLIHMAVQAVSVTIHSFCA